MELLNKNFKINTKVTSLPEDDIATEPLEDIAVPVDVENAKQALNFQISRVAKLRDLYADEAARENRQNLTTALGTQTYTSAAGIRNLLAESFNNKEEAVNLSKKLYATNPIYQTFIDYLANSYAWKYKVIPHKVYTKSKAKIKKVLDNDDFTVMYNLMLEIVDGLHIPNKIPSLLVKLFVEGSVFFTTYSDEDSITIDTILLPTDFCRRIGETQYGTAIIQFDFSYFGQLGLNNENLNTFFKSFPKEFKTKYNKYLADQNLRWQTLDSHYSSNLSMNEYGIPVLLYLYGSILDYEKYQDNELERNENLLKYLVVHEMPHYNNDLIFETDEVNAIHKSLRRKIEVNDKAKLVTTWGKIYVEKMSENDTAENQVLTNAFKAIFNNGGLNHNIFTSESVEALKMSIIRDRSFVWKYVQQLVSFYNIAINNWYDFRGYEADFDILPISQYTYNDDIKVYKDNATLGVNKLDYLIASGINQRNIQDTLNLEGFLKLDEITPMQTSYTQTAEDRSSKEEDSQTKDNNNNSNKETSGIEPSEE